MKTVKVVAAVIRDGNKIFATQRGYGEFEGGWELPGGKIEEGESPEQALVREIKEELATDIEVSDFIADIEYDYPTFHLSMKCFWCKIKGGELTLIEHEAAKWLDADSIYSVNWLPADELIISDIKLQLKTRLLKSSVTLREPAQCANFKERLEYVENEAGDD